MLRQGFSNEITGLKVQPFYQKAGTFKLMLIGQDPTIFKKPERVKKVLMLKEENGQLKSWLKKLFGSKNFDKMTIYATNMVKCSFTRPPFMMPSGGYNFLRPILIYCS